MELDAARALLKAVPVARDIDGKPWHMPIEGQHVFIAGRTGSGKNSMTWSLVLRLAPAWKVGLVRYWGIDPKRIELAIGRGFWDYYADTDDGMVELLEHCVADMQQRMTQHAGHQPPLHTQSGNAAQRDYHRRNGLPVSLHGR